MKRTIALFIFAVILTRHTDAQVGINTDGTLPDNSAMLDVRSTTKGMLVPRMTTAERNGIANPATGLLVFCTDNNQYYSNKGIPSAPNWVMVSSQWKENGNNIYFNTGNVGIGIASPTQMLEVNGSISATYGGRLNAGYRFGDGSENTGFSSPDPNSIAMVNGGSQTAIIDASGRLGVGVVTPSTAAQLEVASTMRGFLPPRMSTQQMNAIVGPVAGLMIFNVTINTMCWYNGSAWDRGTVRDGQSCGTFVYGGQVYNTTVIGFQCWMKENLNVGNFISWNQQATNNGTIEKGCKGNSPAECATYGGLYQWDEMMNYTASSSASPSGRQGICPAGWHLPGDAEWTEMITYLGGESVAGGALKETGLLHWFSPNTGATNSSGFTALPAGYLSPPTSPGWSGGWAFFASATETSPTLIIARKLVDNSAAVERVTGSLTKGYSLSVRCVKD